MLALEIAKQIVDEFTESELNYGVNSIEEEKKILTKLKREGLLKKFQTYHLSDDELDKFIFTRCDTSLDWDTFFTKAGIHYTPKFINDELIYKIYTLHMFSYDNLYLFKQYYDKLYFTELKKIVPTQYQKYVTKELKNFFEADRIDPFTYGRRKLYKYLASYDELVNHDLEITKNL